MKKGKVYLVGAGPGDAELLTRKACRLLREADVILYDSLIGDGILSMIPDTARAVCVGKRAGKHKVPQEETNRLILQEAQAGNIVVRLKGGDPFLFGRGGEELELLAEHDIPFEIVPGVTSSIAVPAYNGIPVTHRDFTSSVHIITGHRRSGETLHLPFRALAELNGTLVFLMGVSALREICSGLLEAGMDPDMPAAVLQQGTTAGQRRVVATVSTLPEEAERKKIGTPAIIVVGKVCALSERFAWYEKLPLEGKKIIVTRPKESIGTLSGRLRAMGAEVLELPAIETVPVEDNHALDDALEMLEFYTWIVFTSPAGVRIFFQQMQKRQADVRRMMGLQIAVIGEGTRKELQKYGFFADLMPETYDGASLGRALSEQCDARDNILIPRARIGNQELTDLLRACGASVDDIPLYDTICHPPAVVEETGLLKNHEISFVVFTSSSTVRAFAEANAGADLTGVRAACIGRQTMKAAESFGMQAFCSEKATLESLLDLCRRM